MDDSTEMSKMDDSTEMSKVDDSTEKSPQQILGENRGSTKIGLKSHMKQGFHMGPYGFFKKMCDKISVHGFGLIGMAIAETENTKKEEEKNPSGPWALRFSILKVITTILVLCVSTGCLMYYLVNIFVDYRSSFLSVGLKDPQAHLGKAYFPDVTICNNNLIKMSFLASIDPDIHKSTLAKKHLRNEIQEYFVTGFNRSDKAPSAELDKFMKKPEFSTAIQNALPHKKMINKENAFKFFRQAAVPTCKDMIAMIYWKNELIDAAITGSTDATNSGICCNVSPRKLWPGDSDTKHMEGGPHEGISLLIDSQGWDYAFSPFYSEGVKISASSPRSFNQLEQDGIFVEPGTNTYAALHPKVIEIGSHRPLSYKWSPKDRTCYIGDMKDMPGMIELQDKFPRLKETIKVEKLLKYEKYDYRLCHELVKMNEIMNQANCTPPEYWEILNVDNNHTALPLKEPCLGSKILEAHQVEKNRSAAISSSGDQICLRNCATQENNLYLSFSEYPVASIFEDFPEYELIEKRINDAYNDQVKTKLMDKYFKKKPSPLEYAEGNLAWLTVYFKYPYVRSYSADVAKTRSAVLAEVGGTMGVFLGISFIGIIELFVHLSKIFMGLVTPNKDHAVRNSV